MSGLELLSDEGFRVDGRRPNELRRTQCRLGVFKHADGSAYLEQGNTKVLATVYGPHEPKMKTTNEVIINCQYSMATFSTGDRKSRPRGDRKSTEKTIHLQQIFEAAILTDLYTRSQIDIYIEVLQCDGGNTAASINAATLALTDAGIPLRDFVSACSSGFVRERAMTDLNSVEESSADSQLVVAILSKSERIVSLEMNARLHEDRLAAALDHAVKGCKDIYRIQDRAVREHVAEASAKLC